MHYPYMVTERMAHSNCFWIMDCSFGGEKGKRFGIVISKKKSVIIKTTRGRIKLRMSSTNTVMLILYLWHNYLQVSQKSLVRHEWANNLLGSCYPPVNCRIYLAVTMQRRRDKKS